MKLFYILLRITNIGEKIMKVSIKNQILTITAVTLFIAQPAFAIDSTTAGQRKAINNEFKTERKNLQENLKDDVKQITATRVAALKNIINSRAFINNGKVTAKGTNSLTVVAGSNTYTVNLDSKTRLRRKFFGSSTIDEISINDIVNITGKFTDDAHTIITADQIRDLSIQKRRAVFVGDVTVISGNTITLKTLARGVQTVTISTATKFKDRKNGALTAADILVGHRIRVRGMWNSTNNTVTEVTEVKDYTLPVKPTPKVTPVTTPTIAPTATPTP
jgi:hypothetical protein